MSLGISPRARSTLSADQILFKAESLYDENLSDLALRFLGQHQTLVDKKSKLLELEGCMRQHRGQTALAIEVFSAAIAQNPENPSPLYARAMLYTKHGPPNLAWKDIELLYSFVPHNPLTVKLCIDFLLKYDCALAAKWVLNILLDEVEQEATVEIDQNPCLLLCIAKIQFCLGQLGEASRRLDQVTPYAQNYSLALDSEEVGALKEQLQASPYEEKTALDDSPRDPICTTLENIPIKHPIFKKKPRASSQIILFEAHSWDKTGSLNHAQYILKQNLKTYSQDVPLLIYYAKIQRLFQRHTEALATLQQALDLDPHNPFCLYLKAEILIVLGDEHGLPEAVQILQNLHTSIPGTPKIYVLLDTVFQHPSMDKAVHPDLRTFTAEYLDKTFQEPKRISFHVEMLSSDKKSLPLALRFLEKHREVVYDFSWLLYYRGHVLKELGEKEKAEEAFSVALQLDDRNPYALFDRAYLYLDNGYLAEAWKDVEALLEYLPCNPLVIELCTETLFKLNHPRLALSIVEGYVSTTPPNALILLCLAKALFHQEDITHKDRPRALKVIEHALRLKQESGAPMVDIQEIEELKKKILAIPSERPNPSPALQAFCEARLDGGQGKIQEALGKADEAIRLLKETHPSDITLQDIQSFKERIAPPKKKKSSVADLPPDPISERITHFASRLDHIFEQKEPFSPLILKFTAGAWDQTGSTKFAISLLEKDPFHDPSLLISLAEMKEQQALELLSKAIDLDPRNPSALLARAQVYNNLNRPAEALEDLRKIRRLTSEMAPQVTRLFLSNSEVKKDSEEYLQASEELSEFMDLLEKSCLQEEEKS